MKPFAHATARRAHQTTNARATIVLSPFMPSRSDPAMERANVVSTLERRRIARAFQAAAASRLVEATELVPLHPALQAAAHHPNVIWPVAQQCRDDLHDVG